MSWELGTLGNESEIPAPDSFDIDPIKIERSARMTSGKLVTDIVAIKNRFTLKYHLLTSTDKATFLAEYVKNSFLSFKYLEGASEKTATVKFMSFPRKLALQSPEYWKDITIVLEEQ